MCSLSYDNYGLKLLWQSKDFTKFSQICLHLANSITFHLYDKVVTLSLMCSLSYDKYGLTLLWQTHDFVKFSLISVHLALFFNFSFVWQSSNIVTNVLEFSYDNYTLSLLWQSRYFVKFSLINVHLAHIYKTFHLYDKVVT